MHHALIFGNGEIKYYSRIKKCIYSLSDPDKMGRVEKQQKRKPSTNSGKKDFFDLIICADGGASHALRLNLIPHVIIGDMDSITPAVRKKFENNPDIKWIEHPTAKDQTDSQLAIDYAIGQKCTSLTLCGFTDGRTDHFLATLFYLASKPIANVKILSEQETMYIVRNKFVLTGRFGQLFSLIPLFGDVKGITLTGAKYELENEKLCIGSTRGVSNVITSSEVVIESKSKKNVLLFITR